MFGYRLFVCSVSVCLAALIGCTPPSDPVLDLIDSDLKKTKVDDLSRTMDFVFSERRFDQNEFRSKISTGLNRWVTYSTDKVSEVDWTLDPLVKPLMDQYPGLAVVERTDGFSFVNTDAYYLQEVAWISQLVNRVTKSPQIAAFELYRLAANDYKPSSETKDPPAEMIRILHPELDDESVGKLTEAFKYFDWIVRNIQLLPDTELSADEVDELRLNDSEDLAAAGVEGTGYTRYPWQTLLFGRGDYVERAKLFMIGLQQIGIDSVMLSVKDDEGNLKPWVVGVPLGDEYFLFDTKLALPIPGKRIGSIATLSEVRADGDLIDGLDLTVDESLEENTKYWVRSDQLDQLVGLIYVRPEAFSKRMAGLEIRLIGDTRLPLVSKPSEVVKRLPEAKGVEFEIWDTGFRTHQFRQVVREALEKTENNVLVDRLNWYYSDEAYVNDFPRYRTSRARFFKGKFETPRDSLAYDAIESFESLMYTDATVDSLATDKNLQIQLGILKSAGQDAADFQRQLRSMQAQMRLVRRDTGLFLAQCHFDNGNVSAAANWLKLLRDKEDADRWLDGINYLLSRAIEARKEYDLAIEAYGSDSKSVQAHGNLIRARMLKQLVEKLNEELGANP